MATRHNRMREVGAAFARGVGRGLELMGAAMVVAGATVRALIGPGELLVMVGLTLVAVALWPALGRLALLPVGAALVWIGLPSRTAFLIRPPAPERKPRRTV